MLTALYAAENGEIFDAPGYHAAADSGWHTALLRPEEMIPLPEGAELMYLPGRTALAARDGRIVPLSGRCAVAAVLPVGYTRTHLPAFVRRGSPPQLPLFGYTAAAWYKNGVYVAAVKSDDNDKWHPHRYNRADLPRKVAKVRRDFCGNRIVEQLARCSLEWHCCTAQNLFYRRWEAGIPASPVCNANCLGCISLQPAECCPSPQNRIDFQPTAKEIAAVGVYHLLGAPEPIISFGQGCEGEPALAADRIAPAVRIIRARTGRGVVNINTNGGCTDGIKTVADAGLDSMRVSMISANPSVYQSYYRAGYSLDNVRESILYAKSRGVYVSINMLFFPGLNDRPGELAAWNEWIAATGVDMIQLRNLNMDPDEFRSVMPPPQEKPLGVRSFVRQLATAFPRLVLGSFSHYLTGLKE